MVRFARLIATLQRWLPEPAGDAVARQRSLVVWVSSALLVPSALLFSLLNLAVDRVGFAAMTLALGGVAAVAPWVAGRWGPERAGLMLSAAIAVAMLIVAGLDGGVEVLATPWTLLPVVIAVFSSDERRALAVAAGLALGGLGFGVLQTSGVVFELAQLDPRQDVPMQTATAALGPLVAAAAMLVYDRMYRRALHDAASARQAMEESAALAASTSAELEAVLDVAGAAVFAVGEEVSPWNKPAQAWFGALTRQGFFRGPMAAEGVREATIGSELRSFDVSVVQPQGLAHRVWFVRDVTERLAAEREWSRLQAEQVHFARIAGMAEIATGVLHNVGNLLNSTNVSVAQVASVVSRRPHRRMAKLVTMLREASDPKQLLASRADVLIPWLVELSETLDQHADEVRGELRRIGETLDDVKSIVSTQQTHARSQCSNQELRFDDVLRDVLALSAMRFRRHGVDVEVCAPHGLTVFGSRPGLVQILHNLITNAMDATAAHTRPRITLEAEGSTDRVVVRVRDNGVGFSELQGEKLFSHGFTTKPHGHGFGLHSCARLAADMGGTLQAKSEGEGLGATFTLELRTKEEVAWASAS